jgi:uncharacterized peroxidase-related enzyme
MPFINVLEPEQAEGSLKEIYKHLEESRGKIAEVHKIQSLNPESITRHMDLYMTLLFGSSPLRRYQREMIAVVVSGANDCEYCQLHHGEALNHYWKDEERVQNLQSDFTAAALSEADEALCRHAWQLTQKPSQDNHQRVDSLKDAGFDDRAILDATLIISYFNFVNRVVMGLGAKPDKDEIKGYDY